MNLLNYIFKKPASIIKPEKLENIIFSSVGTLKHIESSGKFERIIAGERIPDSLRKAYNQNYEEDKIHLEPIANMFSGSLGFIDFNELRYSTELQIYIGFMGVEPEFRNRGVGIKLIEKVEEIAHERNAIRIWGYVWSDRIDKVFPTFKKLNYEKSQFTTDYGCYYVSKILKK